VFNENLSKILPSSGWAQSQVTWAKMAKTYPTYYVTHKQTKTQNPIFFLCKPEDSLSLFRVSIALLHNWLADYGVANVKLVAQCVISKYDILVHSSKCSWHKYVKISNTVWYQAHSLGKPLLMKVLKVKRYFLL